MQRLLDRRQFDLTHSIRLVAWASMVCLISAGCGGSPQSPAEKAPRPVLVMTLKIGTPTTTRQASATVSSWKTEEIGFEVAGRVRWVLEPGEEIEGRVFDLRGNVVTPGTVLAQIDPERYELAVESAKAQVSVAELQKASTEVDLDSGIPADLEAAKADLELAQVEYERNKRLVAQRATSQADLDSSQANLRTARARIATIDARIKQTEAQLESSIASIKQAQQNLKDAQRNLTDTTLFSSFRGQVADVHVVPGSVVAQGSPVLTVQMMNPIKVDVELSADLSRTIRRKHQLPITITMPDGSTQRRKGFVYTVSPTADTSTRTFTLTLLVLNEKVQPPLSAEQQGAKVARTADVWRVDLDFFPNNSPGVYYIDQKSICRDSEGYYLWKCVNARIDEQLPDLLEVAKMRITPQNMSIPFLGNWVFQAFTVVDGQDFDPSSNFFAGELILDEASAGDWNGSQVYVDTGGQWMLRPGDLVSVDLSASETAPGFYVPMEAIYEESGETYVFVVGQPDGDSRSGETTVKRLAVNVAKEEGLGAGTIRRITSQSSEALPEGAPIVVGGVHFLRDGEAVRIVDRN